MATKKTPVSQSADKKTENGFTLNLGIKFADKTLEKIKCEDGLPSVTKLIDCINYTDAIDDSDLELGTAKVKMKDGKEHFMLKNGDDFTELDSDHDLEGALNAIKEMNLSFFLRLVANSLDPVNADEATERVFVLA